MMLIITNFQLGDRRNEVRLHLNYVDVRNKLSKFTAVKAPVFLMNENLGYLLAIPVRANTER